MTKQNKPYTNIPYNCDVNQDHHNTRNCPTYNNKCT